MKIKKNKNNNISEESKNALRNFRQNQINSNIKLHKILLTLVILINIGLIIFIFFYKTKIAQIKKLSSVHTSDINSQDKQLSTRKSSLYNKMVNIASIGSFGAFRFSFIFETREEFQKVKKLIYDYKRETSKNNHTGELIYIGFLYQGITDSDFYSAFLEKISFFENLVIMIQTSEGRKFGIYHSGIIAVKDKYKLEYICKDVFLFTLDNNNIYKFKGKKNSINFKKGYFFSLGDDELIIYDEYFINGGYIDFPLKSFDFSTVNSNILTEENGKFGIKNIEVYCFLG